MGKGQPGLSLAPCGFWAGSCWENLTLPPSISSFTWPTFLLLPGPLPSRPPWGCPSWLGLQGLNACAHPTLLFFKKTEKWLDLGRDVVQSPSQIQDLWSFGEKLVGLESASGLGGSCVSGVLSVCPPPWAVQATASPTPSVSTLAQCPVIYVGPCRHGFTALPVSLIY